MPENEDLKQKDAVDREGLREGDTSPQTRGGNKENAIHAEKLRYKNADEIYE